MDFEKLGAFYLGKEYDLKQRQILDRLLMYDARNLTTHAVCVGMTGSGKTGLCIDLLEEAAIDQVPAIIIDPKGDLTNLLLTFPELEPSDFRPWVNADDARRKSMSLDDFAAAQAELWKDGIEAWGQDKSRIQMLQDSVERVLYTPGSEAGLPVSVLQSFAAPALDWDSQAELLREHIQGAVSALLALIGVAADPLKSRDHIFLSSLLEHYWRRGEDLDVAQIIRAVQDPPFRQLGVFDIDTFYPARERFELAMGLNNIIASPAFRSWSEGQPMDIAGFLADPTGKPRHSIFYIAHLSDAERLFFVTLLLNQLVVWMRSQPGTTSLRAILYMDEVAGFFPPVADPPSKKPMLTLLKQARAFGLGVVLATQNPIDLDYKGLTNAGTWFIGRLQTERDKKRLLEGLRGIVLESGGDTEELDDIISQLGSRVFLMHNVHEDGPVVFQTRWAMSYLRGPITRNQIRELVDRSDLAELPGGQAGEKDAVSTPASAPQASNLPATAGFSAVPPRLDVDIEQFYLPIRKDFERAVGGSGGTPPSAARPSEVLVYQPYLLAAGRLHFVDKRRNIQQSEEFFLLNATEGTRFLRWSDSRRVELRLDDLDKTPRTGARFGEVPDTVNEKAELRALQKELEDYLYRESKLPLLRCPALNTYSEPYESERDFRLRLSQQVRERRDDEMDKLTRRYDQKLRRLQDRLRQAQINLEKKKDTAQARKREAVVSIGESILGMFLGRSSLRTASSGMGKYRMSSSSGIAVEQAEESVESLQREIAKITDELRAEATQITSGLQESIERLEEAPILPRRGDVDVELFSLAWVPFWQVGEGPSGTSEWVEAF